MNYLNKRKSAFGYALKGLKAFFRDEDHPKVHAIAGILVVILGFSFSLNSIEWIAVIFCIALVLSFEAINSALEQLTDIASPSYLESAGKVKDIAAGAVLISSIAAGIIGLIIFVPKFLEILP
ncbi:diacylglycerol kinase family protein [Owenweeksia hongkongensis]|uniref:diacylglycerol kinase family protein n=1 Tax=Owenweeksia hongkongensis TaxID=253245 RepID=UPI003A93A0F9